MSQSTEGENANQSTALRSYEVREVDLEPAASRGELGRAKNPPPDETRQKALDKEFLNRRAVGKFLRVQYGYYKSRPACLLVLNFTFRYSQDLLRFKEAKIVLSFDRMYREGKTTEQEKVPIVRNYSPKTVFGFITTESIDLTYSGKVQCSVPAGPVTISPELQTTKGSSFTKDHRLQIIGQDFPAKDGAESSEVEWTVSERGKVKYGIPNDLNVGVVVEYEGDFLANIAVEVSTPSTPKLFGSLWGKDDPVYFFPPLSLGEPLRTKNFDQLTDSDWEYLVPYRQEFQVGQFVHCRQVLSLICAIRIKSQLFQISRHLPSHYASSFTRRACNVKIRFRGDRVLFNF